MTPCFWKAYCERHKPDFLENVPHRLNARIEEFEASSNQAYNRCMQCSGYEPDCKIYLPNKT